MPAPLSGREFAAFVVATLAALVFPCFSAELPNASGTYLQTNFTVEDGLDSNVVNTITQTRNGVLWVGTAYGLLRFDGHRFFRVYSAETTVVAEGPNGDLWMATTSGVARAPKEALDQWAPVPLSIYHLGKDSADIVDCLLATRDGTIWATTRQGVYRFDGHAFKLVIPDVWANRLEEGASGNFFIIGSGRFLEWDGTRIIEHSEVLPTLGVSHDGIFHVVDDRQGGRWYATANGLFRIQGDSVKRWIAQGSAATIPVFRIYEDRAGTRFVSAGSGNVSGVYKVGEASLEPVNVGKGGRSLYADRDDDLWIGTNGSGLIRNKARSVYVYSSADGLPNSVVTTVLVTHDGKLWVGNRCGGISWFDGSRFHKLAEKDGLANSCVSSLAEDAHYDLWVATPDGVFRFSNGRFTLEWKQAGALVQRVWQIVPAGDDSLWFATASGIVHFRHGASRTYTTVDGLSSDRVTTIYLDHDGEIWAGTAVGIDRLEGDRFVAASAQGRGEGLMLGKDQLGGFYAVDGVEIGHIDRQYFTGFGQPLDPRGMLSLGRNLWFVGNGIFRIPGETLRQAARFPEEPWDYLALSSADGLTTARHGRDQPQIATTPDGKIWFAQFQGLTMLDPSNFLHAPKAQVSVGEIIVDRNSRLPGHELRLARGKHHVELHFDTVEISSPQRTHLQYRLEDVDSTWFEAEPAHGATYESIPVGVHRFHVRASNRDGVWDRDGIVYNIIQEPFLYQTNAFRLLCVLAGVLLAVGIYRILLRQASAKVRARLEGRLAERERIARELHDTLLQGFHSVIMRFDLATSRISNTDPAHNMLQAALDRATEVMIEGRNRVRNLRSSAEKDAELSVALTHAAEGILEGSSIKISVKVDGRSRDLHSTVFDEVYWIGHEALANSFHHAKAQRIDIEVMYGSGEFRMCVRDDGRGIDPQVLNAGGREGHWGLLGMRERAERIRGRLTITSQPDAGVEVTVCVPGSTAYQSKGVVFQWLRRVLHFGAPQREEAD